MLRINSTLPTETEELIARIIGCSITVHRALGPGLLETPYSRAVGLEFDHCGIVYTREKEIEVSYRGQVLGSVRNFVCGVGERLGSVRSSP